VVKYWGIPETIVSDRDPRFMGQGFIKKQGYERKLGVGINHHSSLQ
jgi:hypothetical protein